MHKIILLVPVVIGALFFTGCSDDEYYDDYDDRGGYYGGGSHYGGGGVDFHYVETRPYSRSYGQLYLRDGRHYYSRGGTYVLYDRPTYAFRGSAYRGSSYRGSGYRGSSYGDSYRGGSNTRVVNRETNVRNVTYNNDQVVQNRRAVRTYDDRSGVVRSRQASVRNDRVVRNDAVVRRDHRGPGISGRMGPPNRQVDSVKVVEKRKKKKKTDDDR